MAKIIIFWALMTLMWLGTLSHIFLIGHEREPYSKASAIGNLLSSMLMTWLLYLLTF